MLGLLVLVVVVGGGGGGAEAARIPYAPVQILTSTTSCADATAVCRGRDVALVLTGRKLLALDYGTGATFEADNGSQLRVVTPDLPFSSSSAFGAARAADGSLVVVAGDCRSRTPPQVWTLDPDDDGKGWVRKAVSGGEGSGEGEVAPPLALGATLAFSSTLAPVMERPSIYSYGGMCVDDGDDHDDGGWQAQGQYSKTMRRLTPDEHDGYVVGTAAASAPREALAGFSLTALPGSATNISGTVTQRASYVLLGGHTRQAFINMSTAAVWSLPEEAWSYVGVAASSAQPDSRSGHTAVLSADGRDLVILGGWVGDTSTAAKPQLLLLRRGASGAYSSWRWSVPERQPEEDLFGHGAALLPGNVMMVYGGRTVTSQDERGLRFLNLSSLEWLPSYRHLTDVHSSSSPDSSQAAAPDLAGSNPSLRRLALGLGLGLGLALLLGLVIALCAWRRKKKRIRRGDVLIDPSVRYASLVRKPLPAETRFDAFVSSAPGAIHPIPEADEDEMGYHDDHHHRRDQQHQQHHNQPVTPTSEVLSDPFATPPVVFRSRSQRHEDDVQGHHYFHQQQQSHQYQGRVSPEADGSLSSGSYNTARSGGFTALQAEAPGLLLGSRSDDGVGGVSPSKSRRSPRRSWFGSLRRVFSVSGTSSSSSYAAAATGAGGSMTAAAMAPTRPSFDRAASDFLDQPRLVDELLRRRQGRLDWEHDVDDGHAHVDDYDDYDGARGGAGEWDIERAAEQRLVQVMFTVPRERLRVVNGMEEDEAGDEEGGGGGGGSGGGQLVLHQPQVAELVDPGSSEQEQGRRASTDNSSWRLSTAAVLTAEAVTLARPPRTRVLQMVDSIESRSNSPARQETTATPTATETATESQRPGEDEDEPDCGSDVGCLPLQHDEPALGVYEDDDEDRHEGRRRYDLRDDTI
ncbi:hypothetical protein CP532_2767 [Ophiocordyceps camponoti-leonardi (nom. inval.)]|nr:hypothetical protein CP532_2767 [Ophiocordyceps camponoti-leonardi (nom. inval.)]